MFFQKQDVFTLTDLEPFSAKDLMGTISKKNGVSSMLPTSFRGCFPIFKDLAHISYKRDNFSFNCLENFVLLWCVFVVQVRDVD